MREAERAVLYGPVPDGSTTPAAADRASRSTHPALASRPTPHGAPMPTTQDGGLRTACWDLTDDLSMIGKARHTVKETLTVWELPGLADDVVLAVGELLANAVSYGEPPVRLSLWLGTAALCVRVTDHGPELPRPPGSRPRSRPRPRPRHHRRSRRRHRRHPPARRQGQDGLVPLAPDRPGDGHRSARLTRTTAPTDRNRAAGDWRTRLRRHDARRPRPAGLA
ncbi:ATP-binding protein [Sphaerisporangium melleum]